MDWLEHARFDVELFALDVPLDKLPDLCPLLCHFTTRREVVFVEEKVFLIKNLRNRANMIEMGGLV